MINRNHLKVNLLSAASTVFFITVEVFSQLPPVRSPQQPQQLSEEDFTWWYIMLFLLIVGLAGAIFWRVKSRQAEQTKTKQIKEEKELRGKDWDANSVDADKELEWYRKNSKAIGKTTAGKSKLPNGLPQTSNVLNKKGGFAKNSGNAEAKPVEKTLFDELPISNFTELTPAKLFDELPISNDEALISAVEQTQDEYEEDQEVRELAVRILTAFRNKNSVEALSQVALYDLSSNLRSKAVCTLAEFDHESTFDTILLACADPTREVRAAAAKALFTVTFDRGNAWKRIADTNDEYRMIQAARAAIEGDLVDRSIDRLVHTDDKYAYEAFALVALLIKAGETNQVFDALANHRNKQIKLAILHVIKVVKDERTLPLLYEYIEKNSLPEDLSNAANDVIESFGLVTA